MRRSFFLIIFVLGFGNAFAQGYYFRHYQVEDGLSHNTVFSSLQDSMGFMWFGTKDGLNRFDGRHFKSFHKVASDSSSLGNNNIYALFEDRKKHLWVGTAAGLYLYNPKFENFKKISKGQGIVNNIRDDSVGNIWYLMSGTLYRYDTETGNDTPMLQNAISYFTIAADDKVWYGTQSTLRCFDPSFGFETQYTVPSESRRNAVIVQAISEANDVELLIGTNNYGLLVFNRLSGEFTPVITKTENNIQLFVRCIIQPDEDEYWLGTEAGIYIYNHVTKAIIHLNKSFTNPYSLSDNAVYTLIKDKEGGIWAGTYFGGVNYFAPQYTAFEKYMSENTPSTISGNAVREICEDDDGNLWIGTEDNGLNKLNKQTNTFTHFLPQKKQKGITHYNIHGLLYTDNDLWIGLFEHGIDILDTKSGKIKKHFDLGTPGVSNNFFLSFCKTSSGDIYAGNGIELLRFDKNTDSFEKIDFPPAYMHHIMEDKAGRLWISTHTMGLLLYDPATGEKQIFQHNPSEQSISGNKVNSSFEDIDGNVWVATGGSGLNKLNPATKEFVHYNTENGLPSNYIFNILQDSLRNLWISTSRGLVQLNPSNDYMTMYTTANGLLNDQFNYSSAYKDKNGKLYFGSVKGMIGFNPPDFYVGNFNPPIYITGINVQNTPLVLKDPKTGNNAAVISIPDIALSYNQNSFSIDFASLSYTAPEMTQYAYRMLGIQKNWNNVGQTGTAFFTDVRPGSYVFEVKGMGNNHQWSSQPATITITIHPPWWLNKLAYFTYTIVASCLAAVIFYFFNSRIRQKNMLRLEQLAHEKDKELYEAKMNFFSEVAHEIKTPLTLISAPLEKLTQLPDQSLSAQKQLQTMQRNTNRLIALTNQLLDFRLTESKGYTLEFSNANVSRLLAESFISFKPIAEKQSLAYRLEMPQDIVYAKVDEDAIEKIISNLLSNALKYANTKILVKMIKQEKRFSMVFFNDGPSIPKDKIERIFEPFFSLKQGRKTKGTGIGLALSRNLAALHSGTLTLKSEKDAGCSFEVQIPLN